MSAWLACRLRGGTYGRARECPPCAPGTIVLPAIETGGYASRRAPEERIRNQPRNSIAAPLASRHSINSIRGNSQSKPRNTVVDPSVDMVQETELIRQGFGDSLGNDRWRINGRVYAREGKVHGRLFPESGPGFDVLTRSEYKALVLLISHNGYTVEAETELRQTPGMTDEVVRVAREWFGKRTRK